MDVILLERVRNLGSLGDTVKVKGGFARNFLIPQGKAVSANTINKAKFEARRAELEKAAGEKHQAALDRQKTLNNLSTVILAAKAGDEGKLFGSIGTRDIADAITKAGVAVDKRDVRLPEGTLRMIGEYEISVELDSDIVSTVKLNIVPEA